MTSISRLSHLRLRSWTAPLATSAFLLLVAQLVGCSQTRELSEMHDATSDMRKETKELNDKTTDLNRKTGEMYDQLKQGDSVTLRELLLKKMGEVSTVPRRASLAAKYFMSYEYQIWSGLGQDTPAKRETLAAVAVREFLADVQEFVAPGAGSADPLAQTGPNAVLDALSITLEVHNSKQDFWLGQIDGLKPLSMQSMLEEALRANVEIEAGRKTEKDYPNYVREALIFPDVSKMILQTRYNAFGAIAFGRISKIQENMFSFLIYPKASKMMAMGWDSDIDDRKTVELEETAHYLEEAIRERDFLKSIGVAPTLDWKLKRILSNIRFPEAPTNLAPEKLTARTRLIALVRQYASE